MSTPEFESDDFLEEARVEVTQQFKNKDVFDRYLQLLTAEQYNIQEAFKQLLQLRGIDEAEGEQLDIIGRIVGQERELIAAELYDFFSFDGASITGTEGFSNLLQPGTGAPFYSLGAPLGGNILLDDPTYRLFIKAKIIKNNTASTPEEFLYFINFLFGNTPAYLTEGVASFTLLFGRSLTTFERVLLNYTSSSGGYSSRIIPKTIGVKTNFGQYNAAAFFAFQGVPNAKGFGDLDSTSGWGNNWNNDWGVSTSSISNGEGGYLATLY